MEPEKICVLIPAHNEENSIGRIVSEVKKIIPCVVVVDDGSTDNTSTIAEEKGAIVLKHIQCRGKGSALKTGFKYIQNFPFEVIITMDGDGQHSAKDLSAFIKAIEKKRKIGIIVGRRKIKGTDMPIIRRLTNLSMSLLISLLTFQWIPDSQNGFRAIRKNVLEKINPITDHFETETEILLRASWQGIKISSVPVTTIYGKEKSKIKPVRDTIKFCLMLLKIVFLAWKRK